MIDVTNETRAEWRDTARWVRLHGIRSLAKRLGVHHTTLYRNVLALEAGRGHAVRLDMYCRLREQMERGLQS